MPLTYSELPEASADLFTIWSGDIGLGIGTADEIRDLVGEGVLPAAEELTFRIEWSA